MAALQERVQEVAGELVRSGREAGLQVAVYSGGEQVVDVAAGVADSATGRPVSADTPFYAYSVGKAMTATIVHILAERGAFGEAGYDAAIAEFWPEFAQHGKQNVTIRHALTHTAGIPGLPPDVTPEEVCDWDRICARVAGLGPWWEPGTKTAYHAYTFGFILGELVRRVTGQRISGLLQTEIVQPLGVPGELWFGMPADQLPRAARLEDDPALAGFELPPDSPFWKLAPPAVNPTAAFGNRPDVLAADIPAGGKVSARAIARLYAALRAYPFLSGWPLGSLRAHTTVGAAMTNDVTEADLPHLRRCVELAAEAVAAGDFPFGSVLAAADGTVLAEDRNREVTADDATYHPEFALARWAAANMTPRERAAATVYTSGEHCPMCAAAHGWVGLGRIVYVTSSEQLAGWLTELGVGPAPVRSLAITEVVPGLAVAGPVPDLAGQVRDLHRRFRSA